jgi:uncharacterized protein YkwD
MVSPSVQEFLRFFYVPVLNLNFIDIAIIIVILIYALEGYAVGFIRGVADFISFVASFFFAISFYGVFGLLLADFLNIPKGFSNAIGFFLAAFICEVFLTILFRVLVLPFAYKRAKKLDYPVEAGRIAGIIPGIMSAVVLLAFVLTMIVALPLSPYLKNSVFESKFGEPLVSSIQGFDEQVNKVFGGAVNDALTFLTVEPKSDDSLKLNFSTTKFSVDEEAESEMLRLVNIEREKAGVSPLDRGDTALIEVARDHCRDMFSRGYFSHYTPEGRSPFDRMSSKGIEFQYAGENLALAPNTQLAMKGLMNSPGHRANILSENFGRVGIGVIDGGIYGEMFCQEFTN